MLWMWKGYIDVPDFVLPVGGRGESAFQVVSQAITEQTLDVVVEREDHKVGGMDACMDGWMG